ncbi:glycosyltransferase family 2 protein [Cohnella panacarvi]|uniref:glycosyltransferase family 2 protein n=1 Tax=Cohnella panacarvi TaxID=400776 RepID=UPI000478E9E3|nr:glycosyltransferase family 2 protein [Cohnella panacarvi]
MAASRSLAQRSIRRIAGTTTRRGNGVIARGRAGVRRVRIGNKLHETERTAGYNQGYEQGYQLGVQTGIQRYPVPFEGTSIVIPTYNQLALVKQCIETIRWNTPESYEIIVVDNASTDGTRAYLHRMSGELRFRVMDRNHGFAGAINAGLMMAKGRTIVLLNNDTLVTENWLGNMLRCLNSDDNIGMVGPITNYISGIQMVKVPYDKLSEMPEFARRNNRADSSRWRETDLLIGFCLLFRRELFEKVGYFDEGFEIGNYEDNDYSVRVRLLGKKLVIAPDCFIHHIGSVSIKAVGDRMVKVNNQNENFFHRKWPMLGELMDTIHAHSGHSPRTASAASLYPERIIVRGLGADCFWIEQGRRRLVEGVLNVPVVRVSQIDLRLWPIGEPIQADEAERRWYGRNEGVDGETSSIVRMPDGTVCYIEGNVIRRLHGEAALQGWELHKKPERALNDARTSELQAGLPIISPPVMKQSL